MKENSIENLADEREENVDTPGQRDDLRELETQPQPRLHRHHDGGGPRILNERSEDDGLGVN